LCGPVEISVSEDDIADNSLLFPISELNPLRVFKIDLKNNTDIFPLGLINSSDILPIDQLAPLKKSLDIQLPVSDRSTSDCGCGAAPAANRIVGGKEVNPMHSRPYQVFLQACSSRGCSMCGATLINKRYAITAMHCVEGQSNLVVALGEHNIRQDVESGTVVQGIKATAIQRSDYDSQSIDNDIAILRLEKDITFTDSIVPACLPTDKSKTYAGQAATVSGWGTTSSGGSTSDVLKETQVEILADSASQCTPYGNPLMSGKMCAYTQGTDSCQGDSGGPLVLKEDGRNTLVGVVSYGNGCASPGFAGVYARVTHYLDWINTNVADGWCGTGSSGSTSGGTSGGSSDGTSGGSSGSTSGTACDLRCTNIGDLTANAVSLNGIASSCNVGICTATDGSDLCASLGGPFCGSPPAQTTTTTTTTTTPAPTSSRVCDLRCTIIGRLTAGRVSINGIPSRCRRGRCVARDGSDLCAALGGPFC